MVLQPDEVVATAAWSEGYRSLLHCSKVMHVREKVGRLSY